MIYGESGTGKEVFSRAIHKHSGRKGLFVPVNCSAIPHELFESEFFGYEGGAFTGASKKGKMGIFELANNGTVFLDEIADLPLQMQAKLLRVLQENELRRIGGEKMIKIDCRIICATNKNLQEMVDKETFREDLYFRLNVINLVLPSLRSREGDLDLFIHKFLVDTSTANDKPICRISPEAIKILRNYKWKGNVRELKNTIEHMVVLNSTGKINSEDIPDYILKSVNSDPVLMSDDDMDINVVVEKAERNVITKALRTCKGNKTKASKMLNIPRTTLYYKIEQYGIKV
jgi:transcriptional regulator with PAS, ATPase and Fis domain